MLYSVGVGVVSLLVSQRLSSVHLSVFFGSPIICQIVRHDLGLGFLNFFDEAGHTG
jgi:hypothetical protein